MLNSGITGMRDLDDIGDTDHKKIIETMISYDWNNKWIKPNAIRVLRIKGYKVTLNYTNRLIKINGNNVKISFQLLCEHYVQRYLYDELKKKHPLLFEWFFKKNRLAKTKISIEVQKRPFRVDMELVLPNKNIIIIELNELKHEASYGKRQDDHFRQLQICEKDKNIKQFLFLREKFIKNKGQIKKIVNKILIPFIINSSLLHDKRQYVIHHLKEITNHTNDHLCELTYDSYKNKYIPYHSISWLNKEFSISNKWTEEFKLKINRLISSYTSTDEIEGVDDDLFDDDDICSSDEDDNKIYSSIDNFYKIIDNKCKLTWEGLDYYLFNTPEKYFTNIHEHDRLRLFSKKLKEGLIKILEKKADDYKSFYNNDKVWGFKDEDYDIIKS